MAGLRSGRNATKSAWLSYLKKQRMSTNIIYCDWRSCLQSMCNGYVLKNIFNADEMGLFFSGLPTCSLVFKGDEAEKGKVKRGK